MADALFQARPFSSYHQLIDKAEEIISKLSHSQRLEVINAHPRIGMDPTQIRTRSVLSYKEQGMFCTFSSSIVSGTHSL